MSRLSFVETPIAGAYRVQRTAHNDQRGSLERLFCADEMLEAGWHGPVAQLNRTTTFQKGTVRGLHFQKPPYAEMKLVTCLRGSIYDVVVDLRRDSPTRLAWFGVILTADEGSALLVPECCAHGLQTLANDTHVLYVHSARFRPEAEGGIHALDPRIGIPWPLPVSELSDRDSRLPRVASDFRGL